MNVLACGLAADGWAWWYHVLSLPVMCFPLKLCLTSPPAFHTPFNVSLSRSVYHPLMLLLWSVFMISLPLSLCLSLSANPLVCSREGIVDWMWFILTPASGVLWLAPSWHADTHTHTQSSHSCPEFTLLAGTLPQIPERNQYRHQTYLSCSAVMWLDMEDIDSACSQISMSLCVSWCMNFKENSSL